MISDANNPLLRQRQNNPNNPNDPYDNRVGGGRLPGGMWGSQNRAYVRDVQGNETVSQQLNQLTSQNSPYIQQHRQQAMAGANARGMANTGLAAALSQRAAIGAALPIAQQDAATYLQTASENQRWLNERANNRDQLAASQASARGARAAAERQAEIDARNRLQLQRENLAYQGEQAGLGRLHDFGMGQFGLGADLTRMDAGYGYDLGRMGAGYEYDLGRMGYGAQIGDWSADRDFQRQRQFQNDQFRYNIANQWMDYGLGSNQMMQQYFLQDPTAYTPEFMQGYQNFMATMGSQYINDTLGMLYGG